MRSIFAVAMTVAATTSAANLRSGAAQKTSMRRTDLLNSIDALQKSMTVLVANVV